MLFVKKNRFLGKKDANLQQDSSKPMELSSAFLQGTLPSVLPKGMAAHKTKLLLRYIKAAIKSLPYELKGKG